MSGLSNDVAIRIGLAARALPDVEVRDLLFDLIELVGEPLTTAKLGKIRLGKLKQIDRLSEIDDTYLVEALSYIKGRGIEVEPEPLPEIQAYNGDLSQGSILVACSSNSGDQINGHFGSCARYLIYQLSPTEARLVDIRTPGPFAEGEDKNAGRSQLIDDCQVLYTVSIGGPAAAKVVKAGLHPIKLPHGGGAPQTLERLRETLAGTPPPWLAKAMGIEAEGRVRFREEAKG